MSWAEDTLRDATPWAGEVETAQKLRSVDLIKNWFPFCPEVLNGNTFSETLLLAAYFKAEWKIFVSAQSVLFELRFWEDFFSWKTEIKQSHQLQKNSSWGIHQKVQNISLKNLFPYWGGEKTPNDS